MRAIVDSFGPVVCIRPTALPVKSDALMTRAHGLASRYGYTWLGEVRSSRADRLVTAMVSAAARAMTVR